MTLNVYTIFDKIDGSASQLILARSDARVARDFQSSFISRNKQVVAKGGTAENIDDYAIRRVGYFDDSTCHIRSCDVVDVPFCASDSASLTS